MLDSLQHRGGSFQRAPIPENEAERIAALRALDVLDSAEEDIYKTIVKAAAEICETSMASLTFVDSNRQWFKSKIGLNATETTTWIAVVGVESTPAERPEIAATGAVRTTGVTRPSATADAPAAGSATA